MTDLEKRVYNTFLIQTRKVQKKPFQVRKNFEKFEEHPQYHFIKRIANFLSRYPDVRIEDYFSAPYSIYQDDSYFDLNYYASPKGIKAYSVYKLNQEKDSPDARIDRVKDSLKTIAEFCKEKKISIWDYPDFKMSGNLPEWVYQIKHGKIDPYVMMGFDNISYRIEAMQTDEKDLFLGDFGLNFTNHKYKYMQSIKLKKLLTTALPLIQEFISAGKK